jgi:hypothetical protein
VPDFYFHRNGSAVSPAVAPASCRLSRGRLALGDGSGNMAA